MSDHVDGPRTAADPSVDLTDLYAFTSPSDQTRTVLIANVFPFAGDAALFSNVVNYDLVIRPAVVTGIGNAASFKAQDPEIRFSFQFDVLNANVEDQQQAGICRLPDGRTLTVAVGNESGSITPDGRFRIFAGLRSDPFYIGWAPGEGLKSLPNLLEEDNVLSIVVEFETASVLNVTGTTLFGVIAETTPQAVLSRQLIPPPPRFDWIGRPEQTNFRLNGIAGATDLRDLWNQETPFEVSIDLIPIFKDRLIQSLKLWDMRDGKADWDLSALAASANVFLDDFLLFDPTKPISDTSHLEIEKSTIGGRPYETGGGRTLNANAIDILVTWLVNRDTGPFLQSVTEATKPGRATFPYVESPNVIPIDVTRSIDLPVTADVAWETVGQFGGQWLPMVAHIAVAGEGIGQIREIRTVDGKIIVERLTGLDDGLRTLSYELVSGIPANRYFGTLQVTPKAQGCEVTWSVSYRPDGQGYMVVNAIVSRLIVNGMESLRARFGTKQ